MIISVKKTVCRLLLMLCIFYLYPSLSKAQSNINTYTNSNKPDWSKTLNKCWDYYADNITNNLSASDNENLYLFLNDSINSIDLDNGNLIWKNEFNNEDVYKSSIVETLLYVYKSDKSSREKNAEIRPMALDTKSGVPYKSEIISTSFLNNNSTNVLAKLNIKDLGNEYSLNDSRTEILYGTQTGKLFYYDFVSSRVLWEAKVGGAITNIIPFQKDTFIVDSKDNHIYSIAKKNGKIKWKFKLSGRPLKSIMINDEYLVSANHSSSKVYIINVNNGKIVNLLNLMDDFYFVSKPIYAGNKLILSTNKGLYTYSPICK